MEIKYEESRLYAVNKEGTQMGEITFTLKGDDVLVAEHTKVEEEFRGEGVGEKLVEALVDKCRKDDKKIKAECPFVKDLLEKNKKYHDVFLNI